MHDLAERLFKKIRTQEMLRAGDRVGVAVSGGADSVALLCLLLEARAELGIILSVVHVNHKLRGAESDADETFVTQLAHQHELELHAQAAALGQTNSGVEAAARALRYGFFGQLASSGQISKIATAHTLDDQAETVLLRMLRGTGIRGLAGIHPQLFLQTEGGEVVRPLLSFRRAEVETFLREREQPWREDSSNRDLTFLRNRVRHRLLPLLKEEFGTAVSDNLADLAEIARAEEDHWKSGHAEISAVEKGQSLLIDSLAALPLAAQRRLVDEWLEANSVTPSFRWIEQLRDLASGPSGKTLELPKGQRARRTQHELRIEPTENETPDYEYRLPVPGQIDVPELESRVEALLVERESVQSPERESLLDLAQIQAELVVRNWRPGDRYWPAHTRAEKKIKELLNDRHIVGAAKHRWPVAVAENGALVWMRGFAAPMKFAAPPNGQALWIRVIDSRNGE